MAKEYKHTFELIKAEAGITENGVVALMNHPVGDMSYISSTIVHLHIKDGEVRSYDVIHNGTTNTNWVEDFTGMHPTLIWAWVTAPDPINFYGTPETRSAANIYT